MFGNSWGNSYIPCLEVIITHRFTCGERKKHRKVSKYYETDCRLIWICRTQWWWSLFLFLTGNPFLDKLAPKIQNCQFNLTFAGWCNLNLQNSVAVFASFVLDRKHPFWANLVQKVIIATLTWNLVFYLFFYFLFI